MTPVFKEPEGHSLVDDVDRWVEISLDAVGDNLALAREMVRPECGILAVVKADAYGLGAIPVSRFLEGKANVLGVTTVEEGIELRENGITMPILVFTPANRLNVSYLRQYQLTATVDSQESIRVIAESGLGAHPCHLKVNMGMNRIGCRTQEVEDLLLQMKESSSIQIAGIYGHLATAKDRFSYKAKKQINSFCTLIKELDDKAIPRGIAHIANSAAFLRFPESHLDMVRLGNFLYGQAGKNPSWGGSLKNPFRAFARVIAVREVKCKDAIGYGGDRLVIRKQNIAIISIGFADGFAVEPQVRDDGIIGVIRQAVQKAARLAVRRPLHYAVWQGHKLRLIGRVGMQLCAVRTEGFDICVGDIVELRMFRFSASSRLSRCYFRQGVLAERRGITESKKQGLLNN